MTHQRRLKDKVVVLTGACGDIGLATALAAAKEGGKLVLNDIVRDEEAIARLDHLGITPRNALYLRGDISKQQTSESLIETAMERFGSIDICIGNAAVVEPCPFLDLTGRSWARQLAVNLAGCFYISQAAARAMVKAQARGRIIFTSSWVQDIPSANLAPYCVSKGGLKMLAKCMALELGPHNITVNLVAPGFVDAGLSGKMFRKNPELRKRALKAVPLGRIMTATQVADAILTLCLPGADYMTGSTFLVDGGNSLFYRGEDA